MKKFIVKLLVALLVLLAAAWLLYPTVSNQVARGNDAAQIRKYAQAVREMDSARIGEILQAAQEYSPEETGEGIPDVFGSAGMKTAREYQEIMDICDGMICSVEIPGIDVRLPVYHVGSGAKATEKLVHVAGTAFPADLDGTHIVLAGPGIMKAQGILGSLALTDARMLEDLEKLVPNDLIFLNVLNRTMVFRVEEVQKVSADGLSAISTEGEEGAQLLTIVTEQRNRRLVVRARKTTVTDVRDILAAADQAEMPADPVVILCLGIPVVLLGLLVILVIGRFKKRRYRLPTEQRNPDRNQTELPPEITGEPEGGETEDTDDTEKAEPQEQQDSQPAEKPERARKHGRRPGKIKTEKQAGEQAGKDR